MFNRKPQKPILDASNLALTTSIEEDYIYIIKVKNRHGLVVTIGIAPTEERANRELAEFKDNVKDQHYWLDKDGVIQAGIERKLVPSSAKPKPTKPTKPIISSPRE